MAMLTKINVYSGVLLMALSTVYVGFYMIPEYIAKKRRAEEERLELLEEQFAKKHGVRRLPFKWETELMTKSYDDWTFEEKKRFAMARRPEKREIIRKIPTMEELDDYLHDLEVNYFRYKKMSNV